MTGGIQAGYIWSDNFNHVPYRLRFLLVATKVFVDMHMTVYHLYQIRVI